MIAQYWGFFFVLFFFVFSRQLVLSLFDHSINKLIYMCIYWCTDELRNLLQTEPLCKVEHVSGLRARSNTYQTRYKPQKLCYWPFQYGIDFSLLCVFCCFFFMKCPFNVIQPLSGALRGLCYFIVALSLYLLIHIACLLLDASYFYWWLVFVLTFSFLSSPHLCFSIRLRH